MKFAYDDCFEVMRGALGDSLAANGEEIRQLNLAEPFGAISYDILPWDPYLGVGFRIEGEPSDSFNSADWKHGQLITDWNSASLAAAQDYIHRAYRSLCNGDDEENGTAMQEAAHLIFLAGAQALLDDRISSQLQLLGVDAPIIGDRMPWHVFKYFVFDDDAGIQANYCDVLCANRVAQRLLGRTIC